MRAVTVIRSLKPANVGKTYRLANGVLKKEAVAHITEGVAVTRLVPDAGAMADLLREVTSSQDLVICNGIFRGAGKNEFHIVTERRLREIVGADGGDPDAVLARGYLYTPKAGPFAGQLVGARKNELQMPSSWLLIDADEPAGFPDEWRGLSFHERLELLEPVAPRISKAERVELRGSSARVRKAGEEPGQPSHAWICCDDADRIWPAAQFLKVHAVNADVSFASPCYARSTGEVIRYDHRTAIDLSTWCLGRLNFDSHPTVLADGYTVADAGITIVNAGGGAFKPQRIYTVDADGLRLYREKTGHDIQFTGNGSSLQTIVTGLLTKSTPVVRRSVEKTFGEWVSEMKATGKVKLRCEAPFRESQSAAAFIRTDALNPFIYDSGTSTKYELTDLDDFDNLAVEPKPKAASEPAGAAATNENQESAMEQQDASATKPTKPARAHHNLLAFVRYDPVIRPPRYIVPDFIGDGVVVIAGEHGIGKTTAILPLAAVIAGIHVNLTDPLMPRHWRHVVYITEDVPQAQRILAAIQNNDSHARQRIDERIHLVEAKRMPSGQFVEVGDDYAELFTREVDGVRLPPLIVIDTKSASFDIEDENDNAKASTMIADLKQKFSGLPAWIIGHVAKAISRDDAVKMSVRGASALEGDAHQVLYLVAGKEGDGRYLVRGKTRFEARWKELQVHTQVIEEAAVDEWGQPVTIALRRATFEPLSPGERQRRTKELREEEAATSRDLAQQRALEIVREARERGEQVNRSNLVDRLGGNKSAAHAQVTAMIAAGLLLEQFIPKPHRTHPRKDTFLIDLDDEERAIYRTTRLPPPAKLAQLATWSNPDAAAKAIADRLGIATNGAGYAG